MKRPAIKLQFKQHNSHSNKITDTVYCESFSVTYTGYMAIHYFDGGYNCVKRIEDLVCVTMVEKLSIMDKESFEDHKQSYPSIYAPTKDPRFFY